MLFPKLQIDIRQQFLVIPILFAVVRHLELAAAIGAPRRTRHQLHVIIVALSLLYFPHDVLYVAEAISLGEFEQSFAISVFQCDLLQIFISALCVL